MLLFLSTNMAAMTSRVNQQFQRNKDQLRKYIKTEQARLVPLGPEIFRVIALIGRNQQEDSK